MTPTRTPGPHPGSPWHAAIIAPNDPRHAHLAWPKVARTPSGVIAIACSAARQHVDGEGCPAVAVSGDGGHSFGLPSILATFGEGEAYLHCGNLALGVAEDGALVLLAMAFTRDERHTVVGWRSGDDGNSWQPVDCSALADNRTGSVFGHVFAVPGRGLAVCGHFRAPAGDGIWIAFSPDHGRTWGSPRTISPRRLYEPTFIHARGRLIGLVRENDAHAYHQFVSDDLGDTWQPTQLVMAGGGVTYPSPFIAEDPARPGRLLALQSQRTARGEVYAWTADAATLEWRRGPLVATFEGYEDYSYPWMCHLGEDRWFAVCYAGLRDGANTIWGAELRLPG